ncbi:cell division protein FtsZ [Gluconobacter sphaericus]|uniref:Cell division protein FtsZ n=1 Tax=Gluconobacter sphaericus NBRC 12467 TaxID=1307951 RepID=A0AA37SME9_9PROT|nr:cell division protein FtsZ [Gluconobacter sphaericus]MBF0886308.1 cell division protein FtsZ [Gluconobacter sphaericus]GBR52495.1 cell division protein FtsZ [Gluconobacter sphaericus NBRC 12467]GEB43079.1 cell division protein FtsZ [Gluconobacter sphaericus NBRC 12467]GLQ85859.1 cell division protein FtsZ [Gluconobacter sphaericus NBRC 12467]
MTLNLTPTPNSHVELAPRITVIGVGGGGTNAVDNMIASELKGVEFVVANTDAQQLAHSKAERRVQLGPHLTRGLGAGAKPEIGREAAEEAAQEIDRQLEGANLVFITAGMGGGTGTGAAPVIARMARERGVLTVGVVSKPFNFEGRRRTTAAENGIAELQKHVDTLIVIPNQNLFNSATQNTTFREAFRMADNVLNMGVRGITDLMVSPGLINLDFADVKAVMEEMGKAMMGTGEASSEEDAEDRAVLAAERAISNPLLEDASMAGARGLLINITGGEDLTLYEVNAAADRIREEVADDANIIFGALIDEKLNGRVRVSVVATGIDTQPRQDPSAPSAETIQAAAPQVNAGATAPRESTGPRTAASSFQPGSTYAGGPPRPNFAIDSQSPAQNTAPPPQQEAPATQPTAPETQPPRQENSHQPSPRAGLFSDPSRHAPPPQPEAPRSLFGMVTGAFRSRPPQPQQTQQTTQRTEPSTRDGYAQQAPHQQEHPPSNADDSNLDIPTYLRR